MTRDPDQHDDHAIVRYEGRPNEADRPAEKTRWQRFREFLHRSSRKTHQLGEAYAGAEVAKKRNEAAKVAAEAAEIASRADLNRAKEIKVVNDEIERIFTNEDLPPAAVMMQLRVLAKGHPEVLQQIEELEKLVETLRLRKGVQLQIIQDQREPATTGPPADRADGDKPA